jgi:hypothetical protein
MWFALGSEKCVHSCGEGGGTNRGTQLGGLDYRQEDNTRNKMDVREIG